MTLHVYAAHVQMPALVLSRSLEPLPAIGREQFRIRLDSGPPFAPSSVHLEGDDPIDMAVVFDAAGSEEELQAQLAPALVQLRTAALHPADTLRLFAVDCSIVQFADLVPLQPAGVTHAQDAVLGTFGLHHGKARGACINSLHVWDAITLAVKALAPMSGRKVVLVVSTGDDRASRNTWAGLGTYASAHSTAIFSMTGQRSGYAVQWREMPLWSLCGLTGGLAFPPIRSREFVEQMNVFVGMLRHRYILEFARSNELTAGGHTVDVDVPHSQALVRVTGVSVPMMDRKTREDPATVPYLEADRPDLGDRRPLKTEPAPN